LDIFETKRNEGIGVSAFWAESPALWIAILLNEDQGEGIYKSGKNQNSI
jgi:hypothetical protein